MTPDLEIEATTLEQIPLYGSFASLLAARDPMLFARFVQTKTCEWYVAEHDGDGQYYGLKVVRGESPEWTWFSERDLRKVPPRVMTIVSYETPLRVIPFEVRVERDEKFVPVSESLLRKRLIEHR